MYIDILLSFGYIYLPGFKRGKQVEVDNFQNKFRLFQNVLNEENNKIFLPSVKKGSDYELFNIAGIQPGFSRGTVAWKLLEMGDSTSAHNFTSNITDKLRPSLEIKTAQCIK